MFTDEMSARTDRFVNRPASKGLARLRRESARLSRSCSDSHLLYRVYAGPDPRSATNLECRRWLSGVHSTNSTCPTSNGFNHRHSFIFSAVSPSPQRPQGYTPIMVVNTVY